MSDKVSIDLELVTKAFEDAIKGATQQTKGFKDEADRSFKGVGTSFNVMVGALAAQGITKAIGLVVDSFSRMKQEALDAEEAASSLAIALKQSGDSSQESLQSLTDYASRLSTITTYDDDLIVKNQALLRSLTDLSNDGVNQAVQSATNLAATLGIDLTQATDTIAKAINGKATPELRALGIVVDKTKTDSENLASITRILGESNSTAADKTNTYTGAMLQNDNALGNLLGSIGSLITQNATLIEGIKSTTSFFVKATEEIVKFSNSISYMSGLQKDVPGLTNQVKHLETQLAALNTKWAEMSVVEKIWEGGKTKDAIAATTANLEKAKAALAQAIPVQEALNQKTKEAHDANQKLIKSEELKQQSIDKSKQAQEALIKADQDYVAGLALKTTNEQAASQMRLDTLVAENEQKNLIDETQDAYNYQAKLDRENAFVAARQVILDQQRVDELARIQASQTSEQQKADARIAIENKYKLDSLKIQNEHNKRNQELQKAQADFERKEQEYKLQSTASLFGAMASLLSGASKANFNTVKNFMLAEAAISGYLAVQKALASGPPPWNYAAASAVGIQTAANVQRINSQKMPAFEQGGIVPGNSFSGDRVMARVNSGEMVLNRSQQANLFSLANSGSGNSRVESLLGAILGAVQSGTSIQINGREIINVVRDGTASGRSFA